MIRKRPVKKTVPVKTKSLPRSRISFKEGKVNTGDTVAVVNKMGGGIQCIGKLLKNGHVKTAYLNTGGRLMPSKVTFAAIGRYNLFKKAEIKK